MDSTQQTPVLTVGSKAFTVPGGNSQTLALTVPGGNSQTLAPASHQRWLSNHEFPHPFLPVVFMDHLQGFLPSPPADKGSSHGLGVEWWHKLV